jgi:catechol 2,3-dioxygenase-like lactoylglutathione lyase family enzyme
MRNRIGSAAERTSQLVAEFVVPDLDETLAFLLAVGFRLERRAGAFAVLQWEGSRLFLAENAAASVEKRWSNVRVLVSDVDEVWARVVRMGAPIAVPIGDRDFGLRDFIVAAPGAVEIRFAQPLAESGADG